MKVNEYIANHTHISSYSINNTIKLLDEGNTIPFIARYRKEAIGNIDETQVINIHKYKKLYDELIARKEYIVATLQELNQLSNDLHQKIDRCYDPLQLEDLYAPYKRKRKTKADKAREAGLEPLAKMIMAQDGRDIEDLAARFVSKELNIEDCVSGAVDIIKQWLSDSDLYRERFRETYRRYGELSSTVVKSKINDAQTYRDYFNYKEKLSKIPSHRYLAVMRGEREGVLKLSFDIDDERAISYISQKVIKKNSPVRSLLERSSKEAYREYIRPGVETQIRSEYQEKADIAAIEVFKNNLEQLLLSPPIGQVPVLALDPGFRTGCKLAVIDSNGSLQTHDTIYPNEPQKDTSMSERAIRKYVEMYKVNHVAIGNGTASKETEQWLKSLGIDNLQIYIISESGASIYSASEVAREEFPNLDLTIRGAVSLARKLQDPLSELVKLDPKTIGVGQYQHDVNQKLLKENLDLVVMSCVNKVGINLNTASKHILAYISGVGQGLAENIIKFRGELGGFETIDQLKKVPRLGDKAFEQCAGFLRVKEGLEPLDDTGVHPENYTIVKQVFSKEKISVSDLKGKNTREIESMLDCSGLGQATIIDIANDLAKQGLDPRGAAEVFSFDNTISQITDLKIGRSYPGIVSNITNFGAFVNIGIKEDGLVHISQMSEKHISSPMEVVQLDQKVIVKVIDVDITRGRVSFSMK